MAHSKNSAAYQAFLNYKPYIINHLLDKCGASYHNVENLRDRWFHLYPYSKEIEKVLITKSQDYLFTVVNCRDLKFLSALVKHMADYLSEYTMRKIKTDDKILRRTIRKAQKEILFTKIYTESDYIQKLVKKQEAKQSFNTKNATVSKRKQIKIQKTKYDLEIRRQIMAEFAEVRTYKKR